MLSDTNSACVPIQAARADQKKQLEAVREEAQGQIQAAKEGAAAAQALLAEAQTAAAAENQRVAAEKAELDKQLKVAQVPVAVAVFCLQTL